MPKGSALDLPIRQALAVEQVADPETAAQAVEILLREEQPSVVVNVVKVAAYGGAIGLGVTAAFKVKGISVDKKREAEAKAYVESMMKSEQAMKSAKTDEEEPSGAATDYSVVKSTEGSLQAKRAEQIVVPAAAPAPEPKRKGLNLFAKRPAVALPTVQELIEGDTPQAVLCKAIAFGMSAPTDLTAAMLYGEASDVPIEENGEAVFAMTVLEELEGAYNASQAAGMQPKEMASCLEQVGRAKLIELVDTASESLGNKREFEGAAARLCQFVSNAGFTANALQLGQLVGEVLYEGNEPRRRLERVYTDSLALAAPELLATMGLGGEEVAGGSAVGLDAVEQLRPVLKIKESKGSKLMQDVIQKQMVEVMKGDGDTAGGGKAMERSVEMLETLLNSGSIQKEDLESLKGMLAQSMGMPVEEILERKEELQAELPPEGKKLFDLIERLFAKDEGKGSDSMKSAEPEALDPDLVGADGMKVTVKTKALPADLIDDSAPPAPGTSVKIKVKGPPPPAPTPPPEAMATPLAPPPPLAVPPPVPPAAPATAPPEAQLPTAPPLETITPAPEAPMTAAAPPPRYSAPADLPPDWKPYVPYGGNAALMPSSPLVAPPPPPPPPPPMVKESEESVIASRLLDNAQREMLGAPPLAPGINPLPPPPPPPKLPSPAPLSQPAPPPPPLITQPPPAAPKAPVDPLKGLDALDDLL